MEIIFTCMLTNILSCRRACVVGYKIRSGQCFGDDLHGFETLLDVAVMLLDSSFAGISFSRRELPE